MKEEVEALELCAAFMKQAICSGDRNQLIANVAEAEQILARIDFAVSQETWREVKSGLVTLQKNESPV